MSEHAPPIDLYLLSEDRSPKAFNQNASVPGLTSSAKVVHPFRLTLDTIAVPTPTPGGKNNCINLIHLVFLSMIGAMQNPATLTSDPSSSVQTNSPSELRMRLGRLF